MKRSFWRRWLRCFDHAAGHSGPRIPGWLGLVVIRVTVHNQAPAQNAVRTIANGHRKCFVFDCGNASGVCLQAGQVAGMVLRVLSRAMALAIGVEVASRTDAVTTGAIAFFMDMKAMFGVRFESLYFPGNDHLVGVMGEVN